MAIADDFRSTMAALEVSQSFTEVSSFLFSYLVRTAFELVVAGSLTIILIWKFLDPAQPSEGEIYIV